MNRHLAVAVTAILLFATAASSQTADSPLVAAAKRGAEARRKAALAGTVVYTNDMVEKSTRTLSTTNSQAAVAPLPQSAAPAPAAAASNKPVVPRAYATQTASDPRLPRAATSGDANTTMPREVQATSAPPAASQSYRPPQP